MKKKRIVVQSDKSGNLYETYLMKSQNLTEIQIISYDEEVS